MSVTGLAVVVAAAALGGFGVQGAGAQACAGPEAVGEQTVLVAAGPAVEPMADTPSPTLGSTPQTGVNPPGDNDGDPADFSQVAWGVVAPLTIVVLVGGSLIFYFVRRTRRGPDRAEHT